MYNYNRWGGKANQGHENSGMPFKDMVKNLANSTAHIQRTQEQFIQTTTSHIQSMANQISQLANAVSRLDTQPRKLPS